MKKIPTETSTNDLKINDKPLSKSHTSSKGELLVTGVATGVVATAIIQTGKGVASSLSRHPLILFGVGIAAGFLTHKYRKELISIGSNTVKHSKDFVLQQKETIKDLIAETQEDAN